MADPIQASDQGRWTAVHTRPRCEKKVAEYAMGKGIPCYLPMLRRRKRYQRRQVQTFIPMFPGYVFTCINQETASFLLECNRIARFLPVTDEQERRLIHELNSLRLIEQAELREPIVVNPEIVAGKPILINEGPLRGCYGVVARRQSNQTRVTVNIEMLGRSVSTVIDLNEIELELDE